MLLEIYLQPVSNLSDVPGFWAKHKQNESLLGRIAYYRGLADPRTDCSDTVRILCNSCVRLSVSSKDIPLCADDSFIGRTD